MRNSERLRGDSKQFRIHQYAGGPTCIGSFNTKPSALVGRVVGTLGPLSSGSPMSTVTSPSSLACQGRTQTYRRGGGGRGELNELLVTADIQMVDQSEHLYSRPTS